MPTPVNVIGEEVSKFMESGVEMCCILSLQSLNLSRLCHSLI